MQAFSSTSQSDISTPSISESEFTDCDEEFDDIQRSMMALDLGSIPLSLSTTSGSDVETPSATESENDGRYILTGSTREFLRPKSRIRLSFGLLNDNLSSNSTDSDESTSTTAFPRKVDAKDKHNLIKDDSDTDTVEEQSEDSETEDEEDDEEEEEEFSRCVTPPEEPEPIHRRFIYPGLEEHSLAPTIFSHRQKVHMESAHRVSTPPQILQNEQKDRQDILNRAQVFLDNQRANSTESNLIRFFLLNERSLNSRRNIIRLIKTSITCAHGGRRLFVQLPSDCHLLILRSCFQGALYNGELNVSMFCLLGHYLIRAFSATAPHNPNVWDNLPMCEAIFDRTDNQIGGEHIWAPRDRGHIRHRKWTILKQKSRIPYSLEFGLLLLDLIGLKIGLDAIVYI